ncbi:MAG TPA: hypothetical protein VH419_01815 [Nocardioidaceae bacterium]|jgi:hypothetical protein
MTIDRELELTSCPECGELAEIVWRAVLASSDGPIGHAYVRCVRRHWFLMPSEGLSAPDPSSASATSRHIKEEHV